MEFLGNGHFLTMGSKALIYRLFRDFFSLGTSQKIFLNTELLLTLFDVYN